MPTPRISSTTALFCAILLTSLMSGCVPWARGIRSIDDTVTDWRDFVWGKRAFFQRYGHDSSGPFMDGFLEGYHDMLQGGDGCLPVVPPRRYWSWKYQSAGGQGAVSDWFNGYSAGVAAAKEDGLSNLSRIPVCSQYNGTSTVPIQGVPTHEGEIIEGTESEIMPIPPTIDATPSLNKGAFYYEKGKRQSGMASFTRVRSRSTGKSETNRMSKTGPVKQASNDAPLASSIIPFGSGVIEVSPVIRTPENTGQTAINTRSAAGYPMIVPAQKNSDQPLPSNR